MMVRQSFVKKTIAMKEKEFEDLCLGICAGLLGEANVSREMNNLFYERFGMSFQELRESIQTHSSSEVQM